MKIALQIFSWILLILGLFALLGYAADTSDGYALIGGGLCFIQGLLAVIYIDSNKNDQN